MNVNPAKGILIALWFLMGCGKTEVRTGSPKQPVVSNESGQGAADAQQNQPKDETAGEDKDNQPVGDGSSPKSENAPSPENGDAAPEPNKDPARPTDTGAPDGTTASPSPEAPTPPGPPPPPPEVPLQPSKLGWNGSQLIGTSQLYFLPLD